MFRPISWSVLTSLFIVMGAAACAADADTVDASESAVSERATDVRCEEAPIKAPPHVVDEPKSTNDVLDALCAR